MNDGFYTARGYRLKNKPKLSESMEDYVEMLARYGKDAIGVNELARRLHVRASSVSKMGHRLKEEGLISYEKYGRFCLTDRGRRVGEFLILRHNILLSFFTLLNGSESVLEEVEQIEHYLKPNTVKNLERLTTFLQDQEFELEHSAEQGS